MTDEEEARLREIIKGEILGKLLRTPPTLTRADYEWAKDMHWLNRNSYNRVVNELREKYNYTPERQRELNEGEYDES